MAGQSPSALPSPLLERPVREQNRNRRPQELRRNYYWDAADFIGIRLSYLSDTGTETLKSIVCGHIAFLRGRLYRKRQNQADLKTVRAIIDGVKKITMKKIKVGQIGIAHNHGHGKMQAIRKFPDLFEVVGYSEKSEEWIAERGGFPCYKDLPRMDEDTLIEKCDLLLVETNVWELTETAQKCIDAGKHIHMDKPAGGTPEEFEHLLQSAKAKNLVVQMGYMYRYNPALRLCKEMIARGDLGEIYQIDAEMSTRHDPGYREWLKHFKGGSMYIFGCHLIDLAIDILGEPIRVVPFIKQTGLDGVYSDDNCFAVLEYEKATVRITTLSAEVNGWGMRRFAVMGSGGTVEIKPIEQNMKMTLSTAEKTGWNSYQDVHEDVDVADIPDGGRYDEMVKDLYAFVAEGKKNPFDYDYELTLQKVLWQAVGGKE